MALKRGWIRTIVLLDLPASDSRAEALGAKAWRESVDLIYCRRATPNGTFKDFLHISALTPIVVWVELGRLDNIRIVDVQIVGCAALAVDAFGGPLGVVGRALDGRRALHVQGPATIPASVTGWSMRAK